MDGQYQLLLGDVRDRVKELPDNSIDSIVTDPPYEIGIKDAPWDSTGITFNVEMWKDCLRVLKPGGHLLSFGGTRTYHRMATAVEDAGFKVRDQIAWLYSQGFPKSLNIGEGWGTALKPCHEPILLARKPLSDTVLKNFMRYGTGALKLDRIGDDVIVNNRLDGWSGFGELKNPGYTQTTKVGRYPANVLHDGLHEPWARFFYCAKPNKKDRGEGNDHETVKPTKLMRYLVRLVTPPNGIVLDQFCGSGTTGKAAILEGFRFIGIANDAHHIEIAERRIEEVCFTSQAA